MFGKLLFVSFFLLFGDCLQIDSEIEELKERKRGFEAKALRHEDMASYLQFDSKFFLETRKHIQLAEENRRKAELIQAQIDRLEQKKRLLK